jgi:hypothetical protein
MAFFPGPSPAARERGERGCLVVLCTFSRQIRIWGLFRSGRFVPAGDGQVVSADNHVGKAVSTARDSCRVRTSRSFERFARLGTGRE